MTNTASHSAEIRKALKAKGITSRDVSVVTDNYSMGSSIRIRVKNPDLPIKTVEEIANPHESYRRDEFTGEILCGGNRFVFVNWDSVATDIHRLRYIEQVKAAAAKVHDNYLIDVEGTPFMVGKAGNGWGWSVWSSGEVGKHEQETNGLEGVAEFIGGRMAGKYVAPAVVDKPAVVDAALNAALAMPLPELAAAVLAELE